MKLILNLLYFV